MLRFPLLLAGLAALVRADDRPQYVPGRYIVQLKPGSDAGAIDAHHEAVRRLARRGNRATAPKPNPLEKRQQQCSVVEVVTVTTTVTENAPAAPSSTADAYVPGTDLDESVKRTFTVGHGNFHAYVGNFNEDVIKEIEKLPDVVHVEPDQYVYLPGNWPIAGANPYPVAGGSGSSSAKDNHAESTPVPVSGSGSAYPSGSGNQSSSSCQSGQISTPGASLPTGYPQATGKYPIANNTNAAYPTAGTAGTAGVNAVAVPLSTGTAKPSTSANDSSSLITQSNSIWSLADLSHKDGVDNSTGYTYVYDASAGEGTIAYIFDTGIRSTHEEFGGRVRFGINALTNSTTGAADGNNDGTGHGTHVAGTLAGKTYGVAKKVDVVDVKIFDTGSATMSSILAGLDWAFKDVQIQGTVQTAVFSMSFGARTSSQVLDSAIKALYDFGILTVVAAGNENKEVGNTSPARLAEAFTVGFTNQQRQRVDSSSGVVGSNYGPEIDIWAPGYEIVSADYRSDTGNRVESGTSMATPLVAGLVCYLRALEGGLGSPKAVTDRILALADEGVVGDVKDSKNVLVYNGSGQ